MIEEAKPTTAFPDRDMAGRVALVTGASRGIGAAVAIELARRGAAVGVHCYQARNLADDVVLQINGGGGSAVALEADIGDEQDVERMRDSMVKAFGPANILVNNAGINHFVSVFETTEADFDRLIRVNVTGAFLCTRALAPAMREMGWGRIVNISSDCGKRGGKVSGVHFSASKAALQGLTRSLARQLSPLGITVNDVAPATILTERLSEGLSEDQREARAVQIPIGRLGRPEDVAAAVAFLASDAAGFITGASIDVNGGALIA